MTEIAACAKFDRVSTIYPNNYVQTEYAIRSYKVVENEQKSVKEQ